jgi:hypothetical protein
MSLSLPRRLMPLLISLVLILGLAGPVRADAGRFLSSASSAELQAEINSLQSTSDRSLSGDAQQRLDDLNRLAGAIARSDDRAQLTNASSHTVGVFLRFKKDRSGSPVALSLLGPGQQSDDDDELLGVYVPSQVGVQWEAGGSPASDAPRVARVLEGQVLRLSDGAGENGADLYSLNLPVFALLDAKGAQAITSDLPALSQADLDKLPATAPTD